MRQTQIDSSENARQKRYAKAKLSEAVASYTAAHNLFLAAQPTYDQLSSQFEEALTSYQRALELQPNNESALLGLGKLYLTLEMPEEAMNYFHQAVEVHPSSSLSLSYLANTYLELNSADKALEASEKILVYEPDNLFAHLNISKAQQLMERLDVSQAAESIEHSQFLLDSLVEYFRQTEIRGPVVAAQAHSPSRSRPSGPSGNIRDSAPRGR
jgi:tetratricopeptide (TPR) repeat protein